MHVVMQCKYVEDHARLRGGMPIIKIARNADNDNGRRAISAPSARHGTKESFHAVVSSFPAFDKRGIWRRVSAYGTRYAASCMR